MSDKRRGNLNETERRIIHLLRKNPEQAEVFRHILTSQEQPASLADAAAFIDSEAERTGEPRNELIRLVWQAVDLEQPTK